MNVGTMATQETCFVEFSCASVIGTSSRALVRVGSSFLIDLEATARLRSVVRPSSWIDSIAKKKEPALQARRLYSKSWSEILRSTIMMFKSTSFEKRKRIRDEVKIEFTA